MKLLIHFDGGCVPNPGQKYVSFSVQLDARVILSRSRLQIGHGTNNEAEFQALEMALNETITWVQEHKFVPAMFYLKIETDSTIVRNRLTRKNVVHKKKEWATASERMFNLANKCLALMVKFEGFSVEWKPREHNVARFGH